MDAKSVHGVERVRSKLEACIKSGNYYEAHQMYRTLYFRYLSQQKYSALLDLLCNGAIILLEHDQQTSGADLAILYVEVLVKSSTKVEESYLTTLANLFQKINKQVPERETFLTNALRWSISSSSGAYKNGHPQLHQLVAQIFWKEKNYSLARYHYLHSYDGQGCASMLVELHRIKGYPSEIDLFIAQAVLQYLCLQNKKTATIAFNSYTTQHPNITTGPPYFLPLLNFIWFLLKAIETGKLTVFHVLCERYEFSIKRDPSYAQYLDKIAQIFFGVPAPKPENQGLLGNIFQSFGNLFNDNESDSEEESSTSRALTSTPSTAQGPVMEIEDLD